MFETSHLHPMLVHFPIALALLGFLFEFIALFVKKCDKNCRCGEYLLYFAALSAVMSIASGFFFTGTFFGKVLEIRDLHMMLAVGATVFLCVSSGFYIASHTSSERTTMLRKIGFIFYALSAAAIAATGALGGTLVYGYMIGL